MVGTGDSHDDRWSLLARVGKVSDPGPVGQRLPIEALLHDRASARPKQTRSTGARAPTTVFHSTMDAPGVMSRW